MSDEPKVGELPALTMRDVVWRLERVAGNADTDPRWKAAQAIRVLQGWESFVVHPGAAPNDAAEREARKDEARDAARYRWLRQQSHPWDSRWLSMRVMDEAVDAALQAEQEAGRG